MLWLGLVVQGFLVGDIDYYLVECKTLSKPHIDKLNHIVTRIEWIVRFVYVSVYMVDKMKYRTPRGR